LLRAPHHVQPLAFLAEPYRCHPAGADRDERDQPYTDEGYDLGPQDGVEHGPVAERPEPQKIDQQGGGDPCHDARGHACAGEAARDSALSHLSLPGISTGIVLSGPRSRAPPRRATTRGTA